MRAKVLVIGGGVMGAAIAWQLALRLDPHDEPVVLLEKQELAAGSSGRSGAILRQQYSDRVLAAMARDSLRVYTGFERATGRYIGFVRMGVLTLAGPVQREEQELLRRNVAMQQELGIEVELLDAEGIQRVSPGIAVREGTLAAFEPSGGGVDPLRCVEAFAALARENGAATRVGVRVESIAIENGRVRGVQTDDGFIEAEEVVVAAGAWSRALLERAGIALPLRAVRPEQYFKQMLEGPITPEDLRARDEVEARFAWTKPQLPTPSHPVLLDLESNFYTRCQPHEGRTRVGRMDYSEDAEIADPDMLDENVSEKYVEWARERLEERIPAYRAKKDAGTAVGLYTLTPDAQALIGPRREAAGLWVVAGFSGHGFKLAPSVGEGVAQMVCGQPVSAFDPEFFDPHRFDGKSGAAWGRAFGL
ncbi:MAG: FAD-binding oxidoreductase [Planctomycetes bacterium]|nr:FAD-binding oxidoreductase [Planctomycetota bacterium]